MLEHVALGQSRFMTPGVAPDPRGVVLGRFGVIRLPTLEGVVSWLRLYSAESSLDEFLSGFQILRTHTPLMSRELLIKLPATTSYALDRASRCAQLVGGATFTGTGKHFVKYRDDRSPYGYDATEIRALPPDASFMLHSDTSSQTYVVDGEVAFDKLLFRLSLRKMPGGEKLHDEERQELVLAIERGLGDGVVRYLWRNRVPGEVGLVRPRKHSAFDELGAHGQLLVARVRNLAPRILDLFLATPGITVFRPRAGNVAVEVGYDHVIDLSSCSSVFDQGKFYLFWGRRSRVDVLDGPLELSDLQNLTRVDLDTSAPELGSDQVVVPADPIGVALRLAPSLSPPGRVVGTLIPLTQAAWLKRLVYMLPSSSLRGHRAAVTSRGILVVAESGVDTVPLGQLLSELASGLLVPLGMDLVPRVRPEVLARALGHSAGVITVFPAEGGPFQVGEADLQPLERRMLARVEVGRVDIADYSMAPAGDPEVVNDPVGRFALWGFRAPKDT